MGTTIRTRVAPSPTGEPHVGTAYIALFNYCFAKKFGGKFVLRIEDTDQARSSYEAEGAILDSLKWLGLKWDEGPEVEGTLGPYRQSERLNIYQKHVQILLERGWAYRCFCTAQDLADMRQQQQKEKTNLGYFGERECRELPEEEVQKRIQEGHPFVVRLKVPRLKPERVIQYYDHIRRQEIGKKVKEIDDQILMKSDGFPTYHLANVVDDYLMGITDVIRGEEWIASTPKHILLYQAFSWPLPKFYHLSLLRNVDRSKISKRKNPVSLRWFRAAGYLPAALLNFLGLMGYSRDTSGMSEEEARQAETFSVQQLCQELNPDRFTASEPVFDFVKLDRKNEDYYRELKDDDFIAALMEKQRYAGNYLRDLIPFVQKRFKWINGDFKHWTDFIFQPGLSYQYPQMLPKKMDKKRMEAVLRQVRKFISKKKKPDQINHREEMEEVLQEFIAKGDFNQKEVLMSVRVAITGSQESLPLYESMEVLGIYPCLQRMKEAADFLKSHRD